MTPNLQVVVDYVEDEYGLPQGVTNCRRIAGSQSYSQHSWSNASDMYTEEKSFHDHLAWDLKARFGEHIRNVLTWRYSAAHWNHVHVDMWPRGLYTPPCAGGALRVQHKDGTRGTAFTSDLEGVDDMSAVQVVDLQVALNKAGQKDPNGDPLAEDDVWGPNTEFALINGLTALAAVAGVSETRVAEMIGQTTLVPDEPAN